MKLHLKEPRPLLYFSGAGSGTITEQDLIDNGAKFRCFSYGYTAPNGMYYQKKTEKCLEISVKKGLGVMMDSSAHSFHKLIRAGLRKDHGKYKVTDIKKLTSKFLDEYADYVKKNEKDWDFAVTFDYVKDCPEVYRMQKELEKRGIRPVPVYHGDQPIHWFENYCKEGHKLICIGSIQRNYKMMRMYYDKVFNVAEKYGVLLHGLAATSLWSMFKLPWYSVDSATWVKVAAYGYILCTSDSVNNDIFGYIHISERRHKSGSGGLDYHNLDKGQKKEINNEIEEAGFKVKDLVESSERRSLYNVHVFSNKLYKVREELGSRVRWKSLLV